MMARIQVESLVVAAAEIAAMERGCGRILVVAVYSHGVLIGHVLARRALEDVSLRA